jgi:hypothetical protein
MCLDIRVNRCERARRGSEREARKRAFQSTLHNPQSCSDASASESAVEPCWDTVKPSVQAIEGPRRNLTVHRFRKCDSEIDEQPSVAEASVAEQATHEN